METCDCSLKREDGSTMALWLSRWEVVMCPVHDAAPAMLEALREIAAAPMYRGNLSPALVFVRDKARTVLATIDRKAS